MLSTYRLPRFTAETLCSTMSGRKNLMRRLSNKAALHQNSPPSCASRTTRLRRKCLPPSTASVWGAMADPAGKRSTYRSKGSGQRAMIISILSYPDFWRPRRHRKAFDHHPFITRTRAVALACIASYHARMVLYPRFAKFGLLTSVLFWAVLSAHANVGELPDEIVAAQGAARIDLTRSFQTASFSMA